MSEPVIKSKTEMDRLQIYAELDRLRAELVRLEWIEKFSKDTVADNDRLRVELAELREVVRIAADAKNWAEANRALWEFLAKTAKEGK